MQIDHAFRNREAKTEPAKLAGHISSSLFKGVKNSRDQIRLNPDAAVLDLDHDVMVLVIPRCEIQSSPRRGKLGRVLDQVPEHLLQARGIGPAMMLARLETARQNQLPGIYF